MLCQDEDGLIPNAEQLAERGEMLLVLERRALSLGFCGSRSIDIWWSSYSCRNPSLLPDFSMTG